MSERLVERLSIAAIVLCSLLVMSPGVADPDLWGHVQYGRDWIREGALPVENSYSYTAAGHRWINHENIPELSMAWLVDSFGVAGLIAARVVLALAVIITVLAFNLRRGHSLFVSGLVTLLMAWNLGFHFSYRPQVATICLWTAMLLVLEHSFAGWSGRWLVPVPRGLQTWLGIQRERFPEPEELGYRSPNGRWLWIMPLILMVWTNSHGGFLAGLLIYVAWLGLRGLEAICVRRRWSGGLLRRLALMAAVGLLGTLLNPYSWNLHTWTFASVFQPRPEISDWSSSHLWTLTGFKFWVLLAISLFAVGFSRKERDFTQLVIWSLLTWQALSHFRHVQFFAVAAGFWLAPHLASALARFQVSAASPAGTPAKRMPAWQLGLAIAGLAGLLIGVAGRVRAIRVERAAWPVDAIQFMADHQLYGRTVVSFDWAQYFIAALCAEESPTGPVSTVAMDGRFDTCYPQEVIDAHMDFLLGEGPGISRYRSPNSPPCDPARTLRLGNPELVLNRRANERSEAVMRDNQDRWVLLYQDRVAQVWGRRDLFDDSSSPRFLAADQRKIIHDIPRGFVRWPALPRVSPGEAAATRIAGRATAHQPAMAN
jgi:hypothetical protein